MTDIKLSVRKTVKVNIDATHESEDGYKIKARSMARGIKLEIKSPTSYYADTITIPEGLIEPLGDVFDAVRKARAEQEADQ
ncbi:MAG: hypothetical protein BGN98_13650 [Microbacterium sp. 69-7]|mgnify:CR=1 FL=1|uniref:hypothetical protein n=1 Tax=Microbacterium sp. 69-7 TaxID=1895784 RepID=UPI00095ED230|nr:hypothetical protein [Microbacterium sp. 69-7]OJU44424.1 MAG: hypothetical protein BGN98_13650 [Microbacterium sp. 69-7]